MLAPPVASTRDNHVVCHRVGYKSCTPPSAYESGASCHINTNGHEWKAVDLFERDAAICGSA
jgi:hypothetical protein